MPSISSLGASSGLTSGGYSLVINGVSFQAGATVTMDGSPASVVSNTGSVITVTVPAHAVGTVNVVVTNPGGFNSNAVSFDYVAPTATPTSTAPATPSSTPTVTPTSTMTTFIPPSGGGTSPTLPPSTVPSELVDAAAVPNPVLLADLSSPLGFAVKVKGSPASVQASLYTLAMVCVGEWELPLQPQSAPESWQKVSLPVGGLSSGTYYAQFRIAGKKRLCKLVVMR